MRDSDRQKLCEHYLDFYQMAYGLLHDETEVEDAVQEAMAVTMSKTIVREPVKYCGTVLRNYCLDKLKYRSRVTIGVEDQLLSGNHFDEDRMKELWDLKEQLPESMRQLLDMHFEEGYTMDEISEKTGMSVALVKKRFARTYKQLRNQLEK